MLDKIKGHEQTAIQCTTAVAVVVIVCLFVTLWVVIG